MLAIRQNQAFRAQTGVDRVFVGSGAAASLQMPVVRVLACDEALSCDEGYGIKKPPG